MTTPNLTLPDRGLERVSVGGATYLRRVFPALLGRNADMWVRFRVSMVMDLLTMVAQASLFFFVGQALGSGGQSWTSNYAAFLTVGLVFSAFLDASLNAPYQSIAGNYWLAWLESVSLHHARCGPWYWPIRPGATCVRRSMP